MNLVRNLLKVVYWPLAASLFAVSLFLYTIGTPFFVLTDWLHRKIYP